MTHVVVNLMDVDDYARLLNVDGRMRKWFTRSLKKEAVSRREWLTPVSITTSDDEHVRRAIENGEDVFEIAIMGGMIDEVRHVIDWLAELEQRDPRLFAKLDRITWKQSVEHSNRWHEVLYKTSKKSKLRFISFDENCPVVLECENGLKWVWLKTDKARDDEGRIMGHCVGNGQYDYMNYGAGIFSLRNEEGHPHVTVELRKEKIVQARAKGNQIVQGEYLSNVKELHEFMSPKLAKGPKEYGVDHFVRWTGNEEWFLNGERHREDGPAIITESGHEFWYRCGKLHREDGPAVVLTDGLKKWYRYNVLHRDGGPAIECPNGDREWWVNGELHREDGPAIENSNGSKYWYKKNILHSELEAAVICENGDRLWYREGKLHREDGPAIEYENGNEEWFLNGERHREGGPAIIVGTGDVKFEKWYSDGLAHRKDGPAFIWKNGDREWWVNGYRHREDGPAIELADGTKMYFLNGRKVRKIFREIIEFSRNVF